MWLATEPDIDGVREYLGGVLYADPGVGGAELGGSPSSRRWPGVRGMSDMSSLARKRGTSATKMFEKGTSRSAQ